MRSATCLVLGTGGSARAVVHALAALGAAEITLVSRAPHLQAGGGVLADCSLATYDDLALLAPAADLIVNCTPVGMFPHADESPWPEAVPFPSGTVLYDLVYNPPVTADASGGAGVRALGGLGMLICRGRYPPNGWDRPAAVIMEGAAQTAYTVRHTNDEINERVTQWHR